MAGKETRKKVKRRNEDGSLNIYKDRSWSEQTVQRVLYDYFKDMYYRLANVYMFGSKKTTTWESDFFFIAKNRYLWEIEIKVDRQDFHREFNKTKKHRLYSECYENQDPNGILLPNYYFFCAPEGVIQREEVPEYAGLIEVKEGGVVRFVGERPKLHTEIQDVNDILLKKFYNKSLRMEKQLADFRIALFEDPDNAEEIVKKFIKKIRM